LLYNTAHRGGGPRGALLFINNKKKTAKQKPKKPLKKNIAITLCKKNSILKNSNKVYRRKIKNSSLIKNYPLKFCSS
jgi:hypothetical protein